MKCVLKMIDKKKYKLIWKNQVSKALVGDITKTPEIGKIFGEEYQEFWKWITHIIFSNRGAKGGRQTAKRGREYYSAIGLAGVRKRWNITKGNVPRRSVVKGNIAHSDEAIKNLEW